MTGNVLLRPVQESDLDIFFEQQLDPDATRMAAFAARDHDAFQAHWARILADDQCTVLTIDHGGAVAGNIVAWEEAGEWKVGYWLGKAFWGRGIASAALNKFLELTPVRPLFARVAKHNAASIRVLEKCGFTISGEDRFTWNEGQECEEFIMVLES